MADKSYKVVAPYVMLKLVQPGGGHVLNGFYKGAVVTSEVESESLQHHLDEGLLLDESAKAAALVAPDSTPDGTGKGEDEPTAQTSLGKTARKQQ